MARLNLNEATDQYENDFMTTPLDELIPMYAMNKSELDSYKGLCDKQNSAIKQQMSDIGQDTVTAGEYVAKRSVSKRESMDDGKLIEVLQKHNIPALKLVQVVDYVALEDWLYNHEQTAELAEDLARCKNVTEVVQLRVTNKKAKKGDE